MQIDARGSSSNAVLGLFSGRQPRTVAANCCTSENDARTDADLAPNPTPNVVSNWVAYNGDLANLTISSQPQLSIDNTGNANEVIPTELPDPINRRITLLNANTSGMAADYLAASCSMPSADGASDALYRFVPSQSGPVRVSANYSQTTFDPVIALYRGSHAVIDERILLGGASDTALANVNVDASSVKVYNQARTVLYAAPGSAQPDFNVVTSGPANTPVGVLRTPASLDPFQRDGRRSRWTTVLRPRKRAAADHTASVQQHRLGFEGQSERARGQRLAGADHDWPGAALHRQHDQHDVGRRRFAVLVWSTRAHLERCGVFVLVGQADRSRSVQRGIWRTTRRIALFDHAVLAAVRRVC